VNLLIIQKLFILQRTTINIEMFPYVYRV